MTRMGHVMLCLAVATVLLVGCSGGTDAAQRAQVATAYVTALIAGDSAKLAELGSVDHQTLSQASALIPAELRSGDVRPRVQPETLDSGQSYVPVILDNGDSSAIIYIQLSVDSGEVIGVSVSQGP